jgi:hypothetical protein
LALRFESGAMPLTGINDFLFVFFGSSRTAEAAVIFGNEFDPPLSFARVKRHKEELSTTPTHS